MAQKRINFDSLNEENSNFSSSFQVNVFIEKILSLKTFSIDWNYDPIPLSILKIVINILIALPAWIILLIIGYITVLFEHPKQTLGITGIVTAIGFATYSYFFSTPSISPESQNKPITKQQVRTSTNTSEESKNNSSVIEEPTHEVTYVENATYKGCSYTGEIKNNLPDGKGSLECKQDIIKYVGYFKNGDLDGNCTYTYKNGDNEYGFFINNKQFNFSILHHQKNHFIIIKYYVEGVVKNTLRGSEDEFSKIYDYTGNLFYFLKGLNHIKNLGYYKEIPEIINYLLNDKNIIKKYYLVKNLDKLSKSEIEEILIDIESSNNDYSKEKPDNYCNILADELKIEFLSRQHYNDEFDKVLLRITGKNVNLLNFSVFIGSGAVTSPEPMTIISEDSDDISEVEIVIKRDIYDLTLSYFNIKKELYQSLNIHLQDTCNQ